MTHNGLEMVARVTDLPDQAVLSVSRSNGERVCLIRRGSQITAVGDICTHQEFAMSAGDVLPDGTIQCAWHGARFDCTTGAVRQVPATEPLPVYEVKVDGDRVFLGAIQPRVGDRYKPCIAEASE